MRRGRDCCHQPRPRRPIESHNRPAPLPSDRSGAGRPVVVFATARLPAMLRCVRYGPRVPYPLWSYYPRTDRPPVWARELVAVVAAAETLISTEAKKTGLVSDAVLSQLAPEMVRLGYSVETGKTRAGKIRRPVLFGDNGEPEVSYEIDAFHDELGIAVEVEAGRGAAGNADYRDIVRTSLILDARSMALLLPLRYRTTSKGRELAIAAYERTRSQLNAIYASQRLQLPFEGVLLIGY